MRKRACALSLALIVLGCSQSEEWIEVADRAQLTPGVPVRVRVEASSELPGVAFLVLDEDGHVRAFGGTDPRLRCVLKWDDRQEVFINPCHGQHYNLDGTCFQGPCLRGLDRYDAEVRDGTVYVAPGSYRPGPPPLHGTPNAPAVGTPGVGDASVDP